MGIFLMKLLKGTLGGFHEFLSPCWCRSIHRFLSRWAHEKGTL